MKDPVLAESDSRAGSGSVPWTLHKESSSRVYHKSNEDKSVAGLLKLDGKRYRIIMSGGLGGLEKSDSGGSISNGHDLGHTPFTNHVDRSFFSSMPISCSTPNLPSSSDVDTVLETASRDKIKQFLRMSHWPPNHEVRGSLWRKLCESVRECRGNIYEETLRDTFGSDETEHVMSLPQFVDPSYMYSYHLATGGIRVTKKVVCVIGFTCPDVIFSPTIYGLTSLLLHYQTEEETYNCIYGVMRDKQANLPQTKTAYEATKFILKDLARKYAKPMCQYISKHGLQIEGIFEGWIWWIFHDLPFEYLIRVIDCFILEGCKVLYRAALAILILYHRHMVRGAEHRVDSNLSQSISQFCEDIPVAVDEFFKVMFGLRGLSRKVLQALTLKKEMYVKSLRHSTALPQSIPQSVSCDTLNLQVAPLVAGPTEAAPIDMHELVDIGSTLVTPEQWQEIWGWLPTRITLQQPELIYTTAEHGTSLNTFFSRVDGEEPTLLLIKTTRNEILGAYCSIDWAVRKNQPKSLGYFGTGEMFVFTLAPERTRYSWVGISLGAQIRTTAHMFMAANKKMLLIGGGSGVAIQLDEDMFQGRTERSDTFGNPSLLTESDFQCSIVEVYAFH